MPPTSFLPVLATSTFPSLVVDVDTLKMPNFSFGQIYFGMLRRQPSPNKLVQMNKSSLYEYGEMESSQLVADIYL